jgi:hypothetical protein
MSEYVMQALSPSGSRFLLRMHERPDKPRCNDITPNDVSPLRLIVYHQSDIRFVMPKIRDKGARLDHSSLWRLSHFLENEQNQHGSNNVTEERNMNQSVVILIKFSNHSITGFNRDRLFVEYVCVFSRYPII